MKRHPSFSSRRSARTTALRMENAALQARVSTVEAQNAQLRQENAEVLLAPAAEPSRIP